MAKKKRGVSEKVLSRRKTTEKKVNPFEVKLNKQKHDVLGKKATKFDKGAPGLSRSRALKKRKEKLLKEFRQRDRANTFLDKRLGENDPSLSVEEKMTQRFALEKKKSHEKSSLFNLDEDIELTHYGQSLQEMEKFEAPELSDDDDMDKGNLDADFVSEELFGGFLTKAGEKSEDKPWKERLQEIISKSKKAKHERQAERDQTLEMTEKLDAQWKELQALVSGSKKGAKAEEIPTKADDYDIAVRELKFEMKGMATDRLKSEEEIAQEEVERLKKLEADRQRRMRGELEQTAPTQTHISADDLNDCYAVDKSFKRVLTYKDGKVCDQESGEHNSGDEPETADPAADDPGANNSGEEDQSDEEQDGSEDGSSEDDGSEGSDSDSFADIVSDEEDDIAEPKKNPKSPNTQTDKRPAIQEVNLKEMKGVMEAARRELPYTFEVPSDLEGLKSLFSGRNVLDQLTILQRMKQCNHPSLAEGNKAKLEDLFALLLDYVGDLAECDPPRLEVIDRLTPDLYDLCRMSPVKGAQAMLQVIRSHQQDFQMLAETRRSKGFPTLNVLIHLKLVSVLFPTSDFRHPVATPAMLFISQLLTQCSVARERDTAAGLFLSSLAYEYVASSKRYVPEAVNFLHGLLFLAAEKSDDKVEAVLPPFKPVGKSIDLLKVKNPKSCKHLVKKGISVSRCLSSHINTDSLDTDEFRINMVASCLDLGLKFSQLYEDLPSHIEIFQPMVYMAGKLPAVVTKSLQDKVSVLKEHTDFVKARKRKHLTKQDKKPQPMKMFEPKIETIFDGKKKRSGGDKEYNERQRLLHKHKREMKGAVREIRRDVQFIGREQLREQMQKDAERKKRVRDIHQMLAVQEGDFKALKRKKKD